MYVCALYRSVHAHAGPQINMLALYNIGRVVESSMGGGGVLAAYVVGAVAGNTAGFMFGNSWVSSLGSSSTPAN